jgi:iron complex outermembrane receptor protein
MNSVTKRLLLGAAAIVAPLGAVAQAQDVGPASGTDALAESSDSSGDIIVTARKRAETSLAVPITITAVGGEELERRGVTAIDTIARLVPGLVLGSAGTGLQGTAVLRGIGGTETNDLGDNPVSYNMDGVQISRGSVRRLGAFDVSQVEVLRGPQPLFFGKNSPAGIISIRTADPTDTLSGKLRAYYEFNARQIYSEGFISAPLTDTLGVRLAAYGTHQRGWVHFIVPAGEPLSHDWGPRNTEGGARLTLKYENGPFSARLKAAYSALEGAQIGDTVQLTNCPYGRPQFAAPTAAAPGTPRIVPAGPGVDDCTANATNSTSDLGPSFAAAIPGLGDGSTYAREHQFLTGLELNYDLADNLTLTSQTGYYAFYFGGVGNYSATYIRQKMIGGPKHTRYNEFSQEVRLNSSFGGWINFTLGGFYQHSLGRSDNLVFTNADAPVLLTGNKFRVSGDAYSAFGQLRLSPVQQVELAAGGRYTKEIRELPFAARAVGTSFQQVTTDSTRTETSDFSPEVSLSWRPSQNLTIFGSYKEGFLSGGFNTGSAPTAGIAYKPEFVRGWEGGIKALLLDGALRTNLSLYTYQITDLQVTVSVANATTQLRNAAKARTRGVEFDFSYRTPLEGLTVRGALAYNDAKYKEYLATCYRGQPAPACRTFLSPITGNNILAQDLAGTQLFRAPKWAGNIRAEYETPIGSDWTLSFGGGMSFSSSYFADAASKPAGQQKAYQLYDASIRLQSDHWEIALIGENLSDVYYITRAADSSNTGGTPGTAISVLGDTIASVSRGREIKVQVGYKF